MSPGVVGVIDASSSSRKVSLHEDDALLLAGQADGIGVRPGPTARGRAGAAVAVPGLSAAPPGTPAEALLAPLHQPHSLPPIRAAIAPAPGLPQLAGFDTAFHRTIPEVAQGFALEVFVHRVARGIASLAAALRGLDGIVSTAGVVENAAPIRAAACGASRWLGVELEGAANAAKAETISDARSRVAVPVIPTEETLMIAGHTRRVLAAMT